MPIRKNAPLGFTDLIIAELGSKRTSALLAKLDDATPWDKLAYPIKQLPECKSHGAGRPPWEPTMMLAKWFNLSDPVLEEALLDRISFRKFVGLPFTDATPDETTFVKHTFKMLKRFFEDYKQLEGKQVEVDEIQPAALAHEIIDDALVRYSEARQSGAL